MKHAIKTKVGEIELDDTMVVNPDNFIPAGEFNPHRVRPFVIGNEFGPLAIVFASHEQEAFDEAVDGDKLDSHLINDHECSDDCEALHAGNASEAFDQTYLWIVELPTPAYSFVAMLAISVTA